MNAPSGSSSSNNNQPDGGGEQYGANVNGAGGEPYYYFDVPQPPPLQLPSQQQQFSRMSHPAAYNIQQPQAQTHVIHGHGQHQAPAQQPLQVGGGPQQKRKEIYRYSAPFEIYAMCWSRRPEPQYKFRLAVGSFIEGTRCHETLRRCLREAGGISEYNNKISILQLHEEQGEFAHIGTFEHPYPATKVMWIPDSKSVYPDLIATTGDYLRLWRVGGHNGATLEVLLNNNRSSEYCAPLTSADWNEIDPSLIGTSSIDTTCTIWQLETGQVVASTERLVEGSVKVGASGKRAVQAIHRAELKTQLIAHDKEVYDIEFSKLSSGREIFASAGADGSVRMFDLRHMEYSTIVFEEPGRRPLLRLAWNKQDHNYLATFPHNSNEVFILDIRMPSVPVSVLKNHTAFVNGIAWAPHSTCHIVTAAEDCQALIWDVHSIPRPVDDPILAYTAAAEINQVHWSSTLTDWISICYDNHLELLRV